MTTTIERRSARTPVVIGGLLLAVLVFIAFVGGDSDSSGDGPPLSPSSTAPGGTRGLVLLLGELGADVRTGDRLPTDRTRVALLLHDGLSESDHAELRNWVAAGGTLVVSDTGSPLSAPAADDDVFGTIARGRCTMAELADVDELTVGFGRRVRVRGESGSCFGDGRAAFVTSAALGQGHIVSIGDASVFTNDLLAAGDNSVLAIRLLAPVSGMSIALLDPNPPGSGRTTLGDLIADRVFQAMLQLVVAFIVYALWRSRRVGQPVTERQPVAIAGSQFVRAVGGLHQRTHAANRAATTLRMETRRAVCDRYGIPLYTDVDALASLTASRTGLDHSTIASALGDTPILDEEALVILGHSLDSIRQEVLDGRSR